MNRGYLATMAIETVNELGEARQRWVSAAINLVDAERELGLAEAATRQYITKIAGGPKSLGSNADLRKQALTVALAENLCYLKARADQDRAFEEEARAKQTMYSLIDTERLFRTLLETGASADPVVVRGDRIVSDAVPLWEWSIGE